MRKKILFVSLTALAAVFLVLAIGCGKQEAATATGTETEGSSVTVRLLTDVSGVDDKSYNAAAWRGILEFYGDTWANQSQRGKFYDTVIAQTQDMYVPILMQISDEGYDLIVATGFTWSDAISEVAARNPQQKYMIVDVDWLSGDNILQTSYAEHEGSFLVGAAAALKAKEDGIVNPRFGFIGGVPNAVITKFHVGYVQGVLYINPDAQFVDYYVNSWSEPGLAKTQAKNWYDAGVYIIYSAAGASGNGTIAQAKEERLAGKNVWAIGVDSDQHDEGLYSGNESAVFTSMIKKVETSLIFGLNAIQNNTFRGDSHNFDLAQNGVGYTTTNSAMSKSIVDELEVIRGKIVSGEIKIIPTNAGAKSLPGFPQNLRAVDD